MTRPHYRFAHAHAGVNPARQTGISTLLVIVVLAVGALLLIGGSNVTKYIEGQKANNDMAELNEIRASLIDYANKHNTTFTGFTLAIGCRQQVFSENRCSGDGAGLAVSNGWGGAYTFTITNVSSGVNNGLSLSSSLVPDAVCIKQISYQWDQWARIMVGNTTVKANIVQPIDDTAINSACVGGANTIVWTVKA